MEEPERAREIAARVLFKKSFEECSECEKAAIHELMTLLRKKAQAKGVL